MTRIALLYSYPVKNIKVWTALTDLDQMQQWYFPMLEAFEPRVGFETQFALEHAGYTFTHEWKVVEVIERRSITVEWTYKEFSGKGLVTFELTDLGDRTLCYLNDVVVEDFPDDVEPFARESGVAGWTQLLGIQLREYLLR